MRRSARVWFAAVVSWDGDTALLDPPAIVLKVFTAGYVLVGFGILVEVARRLGMGFITARAELEAAKAETRNEASAATAPGGAA